MKKLIATLIPVLVMVFASCESDYSQEVTYKINEPVIMSKAEFRSSVTIRSTPRAINDKGKISFYQGFLYISETQKGIHIIDNRNPANPIQVGFIELLGNADIAIRNNMLYADSFVDLVYFDVTNPANPVLKGRVEDIFPDALPILKNPYGFDYQKTFEQKELGIVVGWKEVERTEKIDDFRSSWWKWGDGNFGIGTTHMERNGLDSNAASGGNSINGSMSQFAIYDSKLYAVIKDKLVIFDISGTTPSKTGDELYIWRTVETLFSYKDNLFMGTPTGMLIFSVKNPLKPEYMSSFEHAFGCDPVVVDNDLAYITVRSGNECGQNTNDLIIVDVKDVRKPHHIVTFPMVNPRGLGIDNNKLFVCDDGLKIYAITNEPRTLNQNLITHKKGMVGFDVIPYNNTLMMIAEDGLYQYDYSNTNDIKLVSKITFVKNTP